MRGKIFLMSVALVASSGMVMAVENQPQPTDPMSSSRAPDSKPTTGNSTYDAPDKPPGPWGEIPGGGGPSGYNDGAGQTSPQYEGEKFKSAQQSERDVQAKPGGKDAPIGQSSSSSTPPKQQAQTSQAPSSGSESDVSKRGAGREEHHQMVSPEHLGPQGGSTAESGKARQEEQARVEAEASKPQGSY